jgi:acetate---CoA ligase (ADP-forming) subunit beta
MNSNHQGQIEMSSRIINNVRNEGRTLLTEIESKKLLNEIGITTVETQLASSKEEAISLSRKMGFPVVLKIVSPDITHKTDANGVKLGLKNEAEVSQAYQEIMTSAKSAFKTAKIQGVAVERMAKPGIEVIIGMTKDMQFGPVLMFGLGGVWVEILQDVAFRMVPLTRWDAHEMITKIRAYPLLKGYRNLEKADIVTLENILLKLSDYIQKTPEIKEIDLNPVFAYRDGAAVVDARIVLEQNT